MEPLASIIIPIFNAEKYLKRAIESCLSQTYKNIEIILINDGSSDNSAKICKGYATKYNNIKYFCQGNKGVSNARNYGIEKASGKFIFFLDSDDAIDDNAIKVLVDTKETNTLTSIRVRAIEHDKYYERTRKSSYNTNEVIEKILTDELQGFIWGYLFEKEKCPKFDERTGYCEDVLFLCDYIKQNKLKTIKFFTDENIFYNYYQNEDSATRTKTGIIKKLKNMEIALAILDEKTNHDYTALIEDKKNALFEPELNGLSDSNLDEVLKLFQLQRYNGRSLLLKKFSKAYKSGDKKKIKKYYKLKNTIRTIYHFLRGKK